MSMYVDLLTSALEGTQEELSGDALVDYALTCRSDMLASGSHQGSSAYSALANEIAYDRALLKLCAARDIAVVAANFSFPTRERNRLEVELAQAGLDLAALSRRWLTT
jgi:hypothetical protein